MSHQPAALFPAWYLEPWTSHLPADSEKSVEELADSDNLTPWYAADHIVDITNMVDVYHPGETIEPTPSPVQAATARAAAHGGSLTEAEMIAVLYSAGWPEELHSQALAVSYCESRWSPYAVGDGGRSLGLFQMQWSGAGWQGWFRPAGEDEARAHDPVTNARTAWWAYQRSGWGPWSCAR
jgi:hypothetical protein